MVHKKIVRYIHDEKGKLFDEFCLKKLKCKINWISFLNTLKKEII